MTEWTAPSHPRSHKIKDVKGQKIAQWDTDYGVEIDEMTDGTTLWGNYKATVSSVSGSFTARETLNFSGGAVGTYVSLSGSILTFWLVSGGPAVGDTITGADSMETATVDSVSKI